MGGGLVRGQIQMGSPPMSPPAPSEIKGQMFIVPILASLFNNQCQIKINDHIKKNEGTPQRQSMPIIIQMELSFQKFLLGRKSCASKGHW